MSASTFLPTRHASLFGRFLLTGLALAWLSGCSTLSTQPINLPSPTPTIGLWQSSELSPTLIHDLIEASSPATPATPADIAAVNHALIQQATQKAQLELSNQLTQLPGVHLDPTPFQLPPSFQFSPGTSATSLSGPTLDNLQRSHPKTDLLLRFGLTDYGWTPSAWKRSLIAYEVVSTLGITAFFYVHPATRALAGIYLVDETAEESLEAYSGLWVLDKMYRPVRVHGDLVDLHSGVILWQDDETGFSDGLWPQLIGDISQDQQMQQLDQSLHRAMEKLVQNLRASGL